MKDKNCEEKRPYVDEDGILVHEESWYKDREHWSEVHGWN